ncbi:MAG TPA: hypothetical protein VG652_04400 [Gaiellaceae bacterium]|nr:hypothetical protein [Gaiellaceae bacterium]
MSIRERLLETPVEKVPPEMAAAVKAFCEPIPEIRAAYIGLVEVTRDFDYPQEKLAVAFELVTPPTDVAEDPAVRRIALKFYDELPASISDGGCNFLGVEALPVWNEKTWQVFSR